MQTVALQRQLGSDSGTLPELASLVRSVVSEPGGFGTQWFQRQMNIGFVSFYICNKVFYICHFHTSQANPLLSTTARGWPRPECHVALRTVSVALRTCRSGTPDMNWHVSSMIPPSRSRIGDRSNPLAVQSATPTCPECHRHCPECHMAIRTRPTAGSREQKRVGLRGVK